MDKRVPCVFTRRLRVSTEEEYAVFGYFAEELYSVVNATGKAIDIHLGIDPQFPQFTQHVILEPRQEYHLGLDMYPCVERGFRPYVQTTETVHLDVKWKVNGD